MPLIPVDVNETGVGDWRLTARDLPPFQIEKGSVVNVKLREIDGAYFADVQISPQSAPKLRSA